jgi:hypothetical protein
MIPVQNSFELNSHKKKALKDSNVLDHVTPNDESIGSPRRKRYAQMYVDV